MLVISLGVSFTVSFGVLLLSYNVLLIVSFGVVLVFSVRGMFLAARQVRRGAPCRKTMMNPHFSCFSVFSDHLQVL
jgi:hypothetical protein